MFGKKLLLPPGIIAPSQETVKAAAKAEDEKNNPNKIKNPTVFIAPLKIFIFNLLRIFIKLFYTIN